MCAYDREITVFTVALTGKKILDDYQSTESQRPRLRDKLYHRHQTAELILQEIPVLFALSRE